MKKILYAALALTMFSCGGSDNKKPEGLLVENDFEAMDGWANGCINGSLNKEKAHSGVYSVKVNPGQDFSLGYSNQMGKLSPTRIQKVKVHAWVHVSNDKQAAVLVTEVKNPGQEKSVFWDGLDMLKEGKDKGFNKWIEVEKTYDLPESVNYNSQLQVYLWRGSSTQPVYMDDVQLLKAD